MEKADILNKFSFYHDAPDAFRRDLLKTAMKASLPQGAFYFHEGDVCSQIALVGKGDIRVYKSTETGREITLYHVREGETCILTASCVLAQVHYPATAKVEQETEAAVFPSDRFRNWVAKRDEVRDFVFGTIAARVAEIMALVEEISFRKMDQRLAEFLLRSFENDGLPRTMLQLTNEQIAIELGSAREVISRLLKEFERVGAVELARGRIRLLSETRLRRYLEQS